MTTLRTARLTLRRPTLSDVDAIFAIHHDPRALQHNPGDALATRAEAESLFARWDTQWTTYGFGYWVVRRSDVTLGFCGIKAMRLGDLDVANLFYRFDPSAWGHGYATEAASAVVTWAAECVDRPVIARVRPENVASHRVATKAGLVRAPSLDTVGEDGPDLIYRSP